MLISAFWIFSCWSLSLLECGAQNWTQYSKGALTSLRTVGPGLPLVWTWNFYQQRPSFWSWCSLCVSGAAKTQVLSAGAGLQPCLCLLGSDSNCCLQRWLFMETPFLCWQRPSVLALRRDLMPACESHSLVTVLFKSFRPLVATHQHPLLLLPSLHCHPASSAMPCLNIMLFSAFHGSAL